MYEGGWLDLLGLGRGTRHEQLEERSQRRRSLAVGQQKRLKL
jgi:hypothetical protein